MAQLSIAQRTFTVKTFYETGSLQQTLNQFRERFPERPNLALSTSGTTFESLSRKFALSFVCTSHFEFPSAEIFYFEQPFLTHDYLVIFGRIDIRTG